MRRTVSSTVLGAVLFGLSACSTGSPAAARTTTTASAAASGATASSQPLTAAEQESDRAVACGRIDAGLKDTYPRYVKAQGTILNASADATELGAAASTLKETFATLGSQAHKAATLTTDAVLKSALVAYADANDAAARQVDAAGTDRSALKEATYPHGFNAKELVIVDLCRPFLHPA